tara:strand:- start:1191 stop:2114 length:924 start_codon:yes stop_codon:yes gene_type:complete
MKNYKVVVTGGTGLVGKYLKSIIPEAVYLGSSDCDLTDAAQVREMLKCHEPDAVIHLAARVGGILDNMKYPVEYLEENILMNTNLLKECHLSGVKKVIAVLSTCIYPDKVTNYPMSEEDLFLGPPTPTNFSYGLAKRCMAAQIDAYNTQHNKGWSYLIPCNLYGEHDKYTEHNSHFVASLIKKIHDASDEVVLWGSGKPLRQYMHGEDFAKIIKIMLTSSANGCFNVAPSQVYSIDEIANLAKNSCGKENINFIYDSLKPDGQYRKDVDSSKLLKEIGDFKFQELGQGIKATYDKVKGKYPLFRENK